MSILKAAQKYLAKGYQLTSANRGAKLPCYKDWGNRRFTPEELPKYFTEEHNIGLLLGEASGNLVDIDCDIPEAREIAAEWLPRTAMISGRKSNPKSHYWYLADEALPIEQFTDPVATFDKEVKTKAMIVEFRSASSGKAEQTIVPPSVHTSGESYRWYDDGEPAKIGATELRNIVARIAAAALLARYFPDEGEGRHDFCRALSGYLVRNGYDDDQAYEFVLGVAKAGDSEDPETRASTALGLQSKLEAGEKIPGYPKLVASLGPYGDVIMTAVDKWLGFTDARNLKRRETIEKYAQAEGCTVEEFDKRWVIKQGKLFYVHSPDGYRTPGYLFTDVELYLKRDLAHATIEWTYEDDKGREKAVPIKQILTKHSSPARHWRASLFAPRSLYDAQSDTFVERVAPFRRLEPTYNADVEAWLKLLGGAQLNPFLNWLATVRRLDRQTAALLMTGARSAGKNMLALALAHLWHKGAPTALDKVLGARFNGAMAACPLLFGDEELTSGNLRGDAAAALRTLVGSDAFTIEPKGRDVVQLEGSPRIIIAANNADSILSVFRSELSESEDRAAVIDRILHVPVSEDVARFLEKRGGREFTENWVDGDVIARHVLWLEQTRNVVPGHRFLVSGNIGDKEAMALFNEKTNRVLEMLARYLSTPVSLAHPKIEGIEAGGGELGEGKLIVQSEGIANHWRHFFPTDQVPSARAVGRALANIKLKSVRVDATTRAQVIDAKKLVEWSKEQGIGDPDEIEYRTGVKARLTSVP